MDDSIMALVGTLFRVGQGSGDGILSGRVRSAPTEEQPARPLQVEVNGLRKEGAALLKNADLSALRDGDRVLLLPIEEEQRYVILCKVVGA